MCRERSLVGLSKVMVCFLVWVCLLAAGAQAQGQGENLVILPGADLFKSPPGLNSEYDMGECMIPASYFEVGDPLLTGCQLPLVPKDPEDPGGPQSFLLELQGVPLETYETFDIGTIDTVVRRIEPLDFGTNPEFDVTMTTPIELVALKLISSDPIEITCDQGVTRWIAEVEVDEETGPSLGEMSVTLEKPGFKGGTASSTLAVCPRVRFTRIDPGTSGSFEVLPCDMMCGPEIVGETTWAFDSPDRDNALMIEGLTTDNFFFTEPLTAEEAAAVAVKGFSGQCNSDCPCVFKYPHLSENHKHQACLPCPCDADMELPEVTPPDPITVECTQKGGTSRFATCIDPDPGAGTLCVEDWLWDVTCVDQPGDDPDNIATCDAFGPPSFFEAGCAPGKETDVEFVAIDDCCNEYKDSSTISVQDTLPPVITAGSDDLYCLWPANHEYVCFDKSQFDPDINDICHDYDWKFVGCTSDQPDNGRGDGNTTNDCQVTCGGDVICVRSERQMNVAGGRRYEVEIQATDECSNVGNPEVIGFIHVPESSLPGCIAPPEITAQCDASPTGGDVSLTVDFTDQSTTSGPVIDSWQWDFGDGSTSTDQNPTHTYTVPGMYTPTLTVSTDPPGGCNPSSGLTGFATCPDIDATLPAPICEAVPTLGTVPLDVSFTGLSSVAGVTWQWDFGDGNTSPLQNPTHTYQSVGTFNPTVTISLNGKTATTACDPISVIDDVTVDCSLPEWDGPQNNGDPITIDIAAELGLTGTVTILSIEQDEPVKLNKGDNCPDAAINGGVATVNAERLGQGDGRFYHIDFTVDGDRPCGDEGLTICIPQGQSCVDGGALHDSTGPC